jgi:DNA invertase Pin-like site-specific DNA recombinase
LRQSLDAAGDQLAVTRQRDDCRKIAADRGWEVVAEFVDNSISASDKRKARPAYDRLVKAYQVGEFDAIVSWDLDRLTRQPRQLEDWIDAAEERGLLLVTANGEADLGTDGGRLFARIKASVARAEVERKAARQRRALLQRAEQGRPPLGVRLTGYTTGGKLIPGEAKTVRAIFARFNAGDSLRGITAWLIEHQVPTRNGRPWNPSSVRTILSNPRYAGRAVYLGQANGHTGTWEPIIDDAAFETARAKLADPRRRTQVGTDRKHLGSSLYLCGVCDRPVRSHSGGRYRCPEGGHVIRVAASADNFVLKHIRARLARPDLADVLAGQGDPKAEQAAAEVKRLRGRLTRIEADYDAELIDGRRYKIAAEKVRAELTAAEAAQIRTASDSDAAAVITARDPVAAFNRAPLGGQRAVIDFFCTIRLDWAPRGRKFDPDKPAIRITPKPLDQR